MQTTKKYIIELKAEEKEHEQVKKQVDALFEKLRFEVEGDIDSYVVTVPKEGKKIYLSKDKVNFNVGYYKGFKK